MLCLCACACVSVSVSVLFVFGQDDDDDSDDDVDESGGLSLQPALSSMSRTMSGSSTWHVKRSLSGRVGPSGGPSGLSAMPVDDRTDALRRSLSRWRSTSEEHANPRTPTTTPGADLGIVAALLTLVKQMVPGQSIVDAAQNHRYVCRSTRCGRFDVRSNVELR
jgi:hypothetical protein